MIKNITVLLFVAICFASISSCNLLEKDPISAIDASSFWKTRRDANTFMAGIYNSMQTTLRTNFFDWGEVRSDNVVVEGTGTSQLKLLNNVLAANDTDLNAVTDWAVLYRTISLCNVAIDNLPKMIEGNIEGASAQYRDQLGQAYAIRALMYFYALRVWGGVPILTEPVLSVSQQTAFPRSPVTAVKSQILADISKALETIGTITAQKYYIQRAGVFALKTDVHMWFQEYTEAIAASNSVTGYSLISTPAQWKSVFTDPLTSTETIFNLYWDALEASNTGIGICSKLGSQSGTSQYSISSKLYEKLYLRVDPTTLRRSDARFWLTFDTILFNNPVIYETSGDKMGKFVDVNLATGRFNYVGSNECSIKMPIYRFADVLLLRAEALARTGSHQQALDILNSIRRRVGYNVQAVLSNYSGTPEQIGIAIQRTILEERQLEFMGEGKRRFDLCRIGNIYDYSAATGYAYLREIMNPLLTNRAGGVVFNTDVNMGRILFPINSANINANPLLRGNQNPPYSE